MDTTAISAAAEGVGARTSDTKSEIEKSVSWPTAEIIGIDYLNHTKILLILLTINITIYLVLYFVLKKKFNHIN